MTNASSRTRSRMNRMQRLHAARADEAPDQAMQDPSAGPSSSAEWDASMPGESDPDPEACQAVNESAGSTARRQPSDRPGTDYAAYYSREGAEQQGGAEPAFAPPPSMQQYAFSPQTEEMQDSSGQYGYASGNVYRPRRATWADGDRVEADSEKGLGYQVQEDQPLPSNRRHTLKKLLIAILTLALLGGAVWAARKPLAKMLGISAFVDPPAETPAVQVTPEPVKAYDAAPAAAVSDTARSTIARLSGTLEMKNHIVTDRHIVTRNLRADGRYDFYLFTAEGRLLCYFEGLDAQDMIAQDFGGFYVNQSPWLIAADGSALIRTADIEAAIHESVFLHPMYNGWAVVESREDGLANYVDAQGRLMSSLWFSRTFPFSGGYTLAYVDTGSTAGADERYLLYVIGEDGSMNRWLSAGHMEDAVAAVCAMAYMSDGSLYRLPKVDEPLLCSPEVIAYPDCDALVVKDPLSGKYGLFVHGEQHYAYAYDSIRPLPSDLVWTEKTLAGASSSLTIRAVNGADGVLPLSCSFVLEGEDGCEYVALSAVSSCPIRLDGEF